MNAIISGKENPNAMVFNVIATYSGATEELYISQYRTDILPVYYLRINAKYMGAQFIFPVRSISPYVRNNNMKFSFPDKENSFASETILYVYWNDTYAYVYTSDGTPSDVVSSYEIGTIS